MSVGAKLDLSKLLWRFCSLFCKGWRDNGGYFFPFLELVRLGQISALENDSVGIPKCG